jgi:hypothetical protein
MSESPFAPGIPSPRISVGRGSPVPRLKGRLRQNGFKHAKRRVRAIEPTVGDRRSDGHLDRFALENRLVLKSLQVGTVAWLGNLACLGNSDPGGMKVYAPVGEETFAAFKATVRVLWGL